MKSLFTITLVCLTTCIFAQTITIQADSYQHQFEGGGVSIGLYLGHHFSMNDANRDRVVQLINRDCNMAYIQDYVATSLYPPMDNNYFDRRSEYVLAAKRYRPDLKFSVTTNRFPQELTETRSIGGTVRTVLKTDDTLIYDKVAQFYYTILKGFKDRGVEVDVLNIVNEPDFDKQYYYGQNGDTQRAVGFLFGQAVPKLKVILRDSLRNPQQIKIPLIMGPSTLDPNACLSYLRYFKQNFPFAWANIDIVATHQYANGTNETMLRAVQTETAGKPYFQSEMHTNRGDNLSALPIDSSHRGVLSLAATMGAAIRNGVSAWLYFQTNYPHPYTPGGLLRADWQTTEPQPYQHYYAFQQMTSTQPPFSHVIDRNLFLMGGSEVFVFRKKDADTIYLNVANYLNTNRAIIIDFQSVIAQYAIKSYQQIVTDGVRQAAVFSTATFNQTVASIAPQLPPYSVSTFKIALAKEPILGTREVGNDKIQAVQIGRTVQVLGGNDVILQTITAFNALGQLVSQEAIFNTSAQIEVANWTTGFYFLSVKTEKGVLVKKVFVKN